MIDQPAFADPPEPARHRGRIGQWSDRVKALALLVLLAIAGGVVGVPATAAGDAGSTREGMSNACSGLRASLPDLPVTVLAGHPDDQHPDHADGGNPHPRALAPAAILSPLPTAAGPVLPVIQPALARPPAGHDSRMPTGPPARLSI